MRQLAIVIPTLGRPAVLARTLERLAGQRGGSGFAGPTGLEVIVVSDATDPDPDAIARVVAGSPVAGRHLVAQRAGASAARNAGWRIADSDLVLFLGDDMLPAPGLAAAHWEEHGAHPEQRDAVLGHVRWAPELRPDPFMLWLDRGIHFDYAAIARVGVTGWGHFYTANASVKRALLDRVDGFDEVVFPFHYEDLEIARRMHDAVGGLRLRYRGDALADHLHRMTLDQWRDRLRGIAAAERRFVARYPDVPPYYHDLFTRATRALPARGRGRHLARVVAPGVPWLGARVWASVDAYYTQQLAPHFLAGWEVAGVADPPGAAAPAIPGA